MIWVLFIAVAVLLVGGFAALVTGRLHYDPLAEATTTQSEPHLSDGFAADEISALRFDTALRGYRMDQVDTVLDRLQDRIAELEQRVAEPSDRLVEPSDRLVEPSDRLAEPSDHLAEPQERVEAPHDGTDALR